MIINRVGIKYWIRIVNISRIAEWKVKPRIKPGVSRRRPDDRIKSIVITAIITAIRYPVATGSEMNTEVKIRASNGVMHTHAEPIPRVVAHTKTPGTRSRIIIPTIPRTIIPSSPIHRYAVIDVTSGVAGQIAHIDHVGGGIVHIGVFHIVHR